MENEPEKKVDNVFDVLNAWVTGTEGSAANLAAAIGPWLTPLAPANNTYQHLVYTMAYPEWVAFALAVVVEVLGFASISTIVRFWMHNRRYSATDRKAPLQWAVLTFLSYLLVTMSINVVLDVASLIGKVVEPVAYARVLVNALLSILTVPAGVLVAIRVAHRDNVDAFEERKLELRRMRSQQHNNGTEQRDNGTPTESGPTKNQRYKAQFFADIQSGRVQQWLTTNNTILNAQAVLDYAREAWHVGVPVRTAYRWLADLRANTTLAQTVTIGEE